MTEERLPNIHLEEAARDFEETVEGIRRGLEAAAAGDEMPFAEYVAQEREKHRQRDAARAAAEVRGVTTWR